MAKRQRNEHYRWLQANYSFSFSFPMKESVMLLLNKYGFRNEYTGWLITTTILPWTNLQGHSKYDELRELAEHEIRLRTGALSLEYLDRQGNKTIPVNSWERLAIADTIRDSIREKLTKWSFPTMQLLEEIAEKATGHPDNVTDFLQKERLLFVMDSYLTKTYGPLYYHNQHPAILAKACQHVLDNQDSVSMIKDDELVIFRDRHVDWSLLSAYEEVLEQAPFSLSNGKAAIKELQRRWNTRLKDGVISRIINVYEHWPARINPDDKRRVIKKQRMLGAYSADSPERKYIQELKALRDDTQNEHKWNYNYAVSQFLYYVFSGEIIRQGVLNEDIAALINDLLRLFDYLSSETNVKDEVNAYKKRNMRRFLALNPETSIYKRIV